MNEHLTTSRAGRQLIRHFEGLVLVAAPCPAGIPTVGVGHTGDDVRLGMVITRADADRLLTRDLKRFEAVVKDAVTVPLSQGEFDALVSLVFNIGEGAFRSSTCLKRLNAGDRDGAAEALTWWNKATVNGEKVEVDGLTRRRKAEADLFFNSKPKVQPIRLPDNVCRWTERRRP
ncbi:lysozyme [Parvularcula flava]|uniref:Lysozyme n=1 Tax=Aquisalinus luteolus TaxID=1566827 RepID=A0A8J3ERS1_9PROT|nr:lysozyme [Aquisalinus luteolus]NHK29203.1 lysozyme [Aquisalinus luteolus]GGH99987.1 lysozyme [Aquisalinus luteolus]